MRGGSRSGAGRKKGQVSKATEIRQAMIAKAVAKGVTPLDFMLAVMRDETADFKDRFEAAKGAAPYVHPRLAAVEHSGNDDKPLGFMIVSSVPRQEDEYLNGHANGRSQDH